MTVVSTDMSRKIYTLYGFLRENAPDANIDTLKQISIYVASIVHNGFDINDDSNRLSFDKKNNCYIFKLGDNRKIVFSNTLQFGFQVFKFDLDNKLVMSSNVFERVSGDLTTLNVYSEITSDNFGKYVVTFRPNDMSDSTLKFGTINYYTNEEVEWIYDVSGKNSIQLDFDIVAKENGIYPFAEKSFFDLPLEYKDTELDCYDGCLKNYLNRVDLLFDNIKTYMNTDVKKKERKL